MVLWEVEREQYFGSKGYLLSECYFALFGIIDGIIPADAVKSADKRLNQTECCR